jgi:hypothetical protein
MIGLFKTILFLIAFYYISKFVLRIWIRNKIQQHLNKHGEEIYDNHIDKANKQKGKVTIHGVSNNSKSSKGSAEYADYEEVKD